MIHKNVKNSDFSKQIVKNAVLNLNFAKFALV